MPLTGLTAVESWIVEDEKDKTRFYDLDVPIGTWMLSMKVQNDDVWNDYVKSGKVKGFSIEGYFADKLERPNEPKKDMSKEEIAEAKIEELKQLFTNQKVELGLLDEVKKVSSTIEKDWKEALNIAENGVKDLVRKINSKLKPLNSQVLALRDGIDKAEKMLKDLGIGKNTDIAQAKTKLKIAKGQIDELSRLRSNISNYINY
jgi:hypothetical protein